MNTSRTVRVSIPYIQQAIASGESFEALAFCLLIKLCVTDSTIRDYENVRNTTMRSLKKMTHLGNDKIKRIINYCTKHGMMSVCKGEIKVNAFPKAAKYYFKFKNSYTKRKGKKKELVFNLTLTNVKDMLRKAIVANHIRKIQNIREQASLTKNPKDLRQYKKGCRIVSRLSVWGLEFIVSNDRLAKVAKCSNSKLRALKAEMIRNKDLERGFSNTFVDTNEHFSLANFEKYGMNRQPDFFFLMGKDVYKHNANFYNYIGKDFVVSYL